MDNQLILRKAGITDLEEINRVIADAISSWNLPERVKRLSLPGFFYKPHDLQTIELLVAKSDKCDITGVAGWEPADAADIPDGQLHYCSMEFTSNRNYSIGELEPSYCVPRNMQPVMELIPAC